MRLSTAPFLTVVIVIVLTLTSIAAWGTHVVSCLADERWGFLIAGAILAPIAVIHGIMIWFGLA